jgi:hypothetical protein
LRNSLKHFNDFLGDKAGCGLFYNASEVAMARLCIGKKFGE